MAKKRRTVPAVNPSVSSARAITAADVATGSSKFLAPTVQAAVTALAGSIEIPTDIPQEGAASPGGLVQPAPSAGDTETISIIEEADDAAGPSPSRPVPEPQRQEASADVYQEAAGQRDREPIIDVPVAALTADTSMMPSQTTRPGPRLPEEIRDLLADIQRRLDIPIKGLVANAGSGRARFQEIESMLPDELFGAFNPVAFMEYHRIKVTRAQRRISERRAQAEQIVLATSAEQRVEEEKKYEAIQTKSAEIQTRLDRLKQERADLQAALAAKDKEIQTEEDALAKIPEELESQQSALSSTIDQAMQQWDAVRTIPGSLEDDAYILAEVDQIRLNAIAAIQSYL
ncbi:uncharacterized protein LOC106865793 [Brachypodium distachyon]|uniref:uncharacterized protein LOC106865793 n=1 Tax=Brachypodium distachyon TaxID=15368 RepID=UPI0006E48BA2|nr:uncharacterized protein LOC106865793 [Brachypodium distachyon]|eukprot:XP_014752091.2 uncharacterized protein LOC106865793 [Brachypodium distachyon]